MMPAIRATVKGKNGTSTHLVKHGVHDVLQGKESTGVEVRS